MPVVTRRRALSATLSSAACALLVGALWIGVKSEPGSMTGVNTALGIEGELPPLRGASGWLNSPPLNTQGLRGKVVLVEFWTFTCINWRRTLPYVRAWAEKYKSQEFVVIGVHTPEFHFEGDQDNVRAATAELGIEYPVAIDTDYAIWRAFGNQYWPAIYLVDAQGHIRYHQFGEANYSETELAIRRLLSEAGHENFPHELVSLNPQGVEAAADWLDLRSPETYTGYALARGLASPGGAAVDRARQYAPPTRLTLNEWALAGNWTIGKEAAVSNSAGGRVVYLFHARDVHLIMAPPAPGKPVRFRVLIDGKPPGGSRGVDVDELGNGTLVRPMMYQLIRALPVRDRQFEIEFLDPGAAVFDFTFG